MTHLVVPIFGDSIVSIREDMASAIETGADMIELRLDMIHDVSDDELRTLTDAAAGRVPMILTCRSPEEGGETHAPDGERLDRLDRLGPLADYIDIELTTLERGDAARAAVRSALCRADVITQSGGREVIERGESRSLIVSRHDHRGRPASLQSDLLRMTGVERCSVVKLAWRARTVRDNFEAFELIRISPVPCVAICMGEEGLLSRVLAPKFGAFATFASLRRGDETAPGQIPASELTERFRWKFVDSTTRVFGVIGDPVAHSLGPDVHNAAFEKHGINAVYVPLRVIAGYEPFKAFMVEALARPWLDFSGFSVTSPHKENAVRFLTEQGGEIDPVAARIGAVNTILFHKGGRMVGANTDASAIVDALSDALGGPKRAAGRSVLILGAGGAARAAAFGLVAAGCNVTIANRTDERAVALSADLGCRACKWEDRSTFPVDCIVNCTTVGMSPNDGESPMPPDALRSDQLILESVYNPRKTRLLADAHQSGCQTIDGLTLFARQAAAQFRLWTGRDSTAADFGRLVDAAVHRREAAPMACQPGGEAGRGD